MVKSLELTFTGKDYVCKRIGNTALYCCKYKDDYITTLGSGTPIISYLVIPYNFRITRLELKHTTSAKVDSKKILFWSLFRSLFDLYIYVRAGSDAESDLVARLGTGYEYLSNTLKLILTSENTDRVYPVITIQVLG